MRDHHPDTTAAQLAAIRQRVAITKAAFANMTAEQQEIALAQLVDERRRALGIHPPTPQEAT